MAVSHVSISEIQSVRATNSSVPNVVVKDVSKTEITEKRFVDRISDKKIAEFFTPYGYVTHNRGENDGSVHILCNDCQIAFNDFSLMVEPNIFMVKEENPDFDIYEFLSVCEQTGISPSEAIMDRLEDEIFNKMPYYIDKKRQFVKNATGKARSNKKYGSLLTPAIQKHELREDKSFLEHQYGTTNPEKMAETIARVNSKN